ncbi:hypothetical protein DF3PB_260007 [uncultured Defluviicoccus sp.]|uniref:Uncharacterized protein n=1 Tax=metagenome TaxID=256318 RepID=A0A380TD93_9ZZZZ|nr:hypothetical protein DF3PB_260007 [uncultured Defluviicoccus sp.]
MAHRRSGTRTARRRAAPTRVVAGCLSALVHWHKQSVHSVCAENARDSICCAATTMLGRESPDWVAALALLGAFDNARAWNC